jgi:hypothetical protein
MTFIKVDENSKPIPLDEKIKEKISLSISK